MYGLLLHCAKQRSKGITDVDIAQELINNGIESKKANKFVETSRKINYKKPNKTMPFLGMLAGIVVASIGIGITYGSSGTVIAYGAIIVGILWFFKGLVGLFES